VDQDCDGLIDDFSFEEIPGFVSCNGARSPRLTSNSTHTFVSVLCTEASVLPADETEADEYFDSALAFGWSHAFPQGPPAGFYDWVRNSTAATTTLMDGQGFTADDSALYGAVATSNDAFTIFRIGGYDLEASSRFSVTFNGSLEEDVFDQMEVVLDPVGNVHALACDDDAGAPRYLAGTTEGIRDSDYQYSASLSALGSPGVCGLHFAHAGMGTFLAQHNNSYLQASFDPAVLPPDRLEASEVNSSSPSMMRVVTGPGGNIENGAWVVYQDQSRDRLVLQDATAPAETAPTHTWDLPNPVTLSASMSADGTTVAVAMLDAAGAPTLAVGAPSGTPTLYTPTFPTGVGSIDELEVQLGPDGTMVWLAATNERALYFGATVVP
jgi:hypothetical protein